MSWKDRMAEWGPASLLFLSTDGASANFIVVADPVLIKGKYRGKENDRIGCPVVTDEGFVLFVCGKRCARKLASLEDKFASCVINVTRHGVEGDTDTSYEVSAVPDAAKLKALKAVAVKTYSPQALQDAIKDAEETTNR